MSLLIMVLIISVASTVISVTEAKQMQNETQALTLKQQNIALIAALTAKGDLPQLETAFTKALDNGLTVNEIKEVLIQMYAYAGFPRSLNGINTLMAVLEERKAKGTNDEQGRDASPITAQGSKYQRGKKVLETLTGSQDPGKSSGFGAFAPTIETFLKEHLFADIFERDILSYQDRELATIAALASLGGVEPMLQSHIGMGLNVGLTEAQLVEVMAIVKDAIGQQEAKTGLEILHKVVSSRKQQ